MNQKVAKRIRRKLKIEFPKQGTDIHYDRDIKKLSKETKQTLKDSRNLCQNPKPKISKRKLRIGGKAGFGNKLVIIKTWREKQPSISGIHRNKIRTIITYRHKKVARTKCVLI